MSRLCTSACCRLSARLVSLDNRFPQLLAVHRRADPFGHELSDQSLGRPGSTVVKRSASTPRTADRPRGRTGSGCRRCLGRCGPHAKLQLEAPIGSSRLGPSARVGRVSANTSDTAWLLGIVEIDRGAVAEPRHTQPHGAGEHLNRLARGGQGPQHVEHVQIWLHGSVELG